MSEQANNPQKRCQAELVVRNKVDIGRTARRTLESLAWQRVSVKLEITY